MKAKKIIIIVVAVAVIATILYFIIRKTKTPETVEEWIDSIDTTRSNKKIIKSYLEKAKSAQNISSNAAKNNCTYEQAWALTAAYYLVTEGVVEEAEWWRWKNSMLS